MSLADLLASLAVLGLVMAATLTLLQQGHQMYAAGVARVESQQNARIALERMAREIRQAGYGAGGSSFPAISIAERSQVVIHLDLDGDGASAGRRETVTWRLADGVLRRHAGGGAQPIINGVRDLELTYLDARGHPTTLPGDVRSVAVTLTTEPAQAPGDPARRVATTISAEVRLRNR